jgi:RNA polymerase sigma factor (sigma-70 family)
MTRDATSQTNVSLLGRLCQNPGDQAAWEAFVDRYGPKIFAWCRHWGLQEADAQDVTQDVLLKLAQKIGSFQYDPARSFRAWLKTLTQHAWSDFLDGRKRARLDRGGDTQDCAWETLPAREDLVQRLDAACEQELLQEALVRVRLRVKPHTWEAFRLQALEGLPGAEVAARLHLSVSSVFVARSRVQQMLQEEVQKLDGEIASAPAEK